MPPDISCAAEGGAIDSLTKWFPRVRTIRHKLRADDGNMPNTESCPSGDEVIASVEMKANVQRPNQSQRHLRGKNMLGSIQKLTHVTSSSSTW